MNKSDLTRQIAEKMSVSQKDSLRFISALEEILANELLHDGSLLLQGFGTFSSWKQKERIGRNPRTGISVLIKPRTSVKFKPGKDLLKFLNGRK